jgi:hypothetical protein
MSSEQTCKKCQKSISGEEFRMVSDWPFCLCCFDELMKPPVVADKKGSTAKETPMLLAAEEILAASSQNKEAAPGSPACQMCGCHLPAPAGKFLGVWQLCANCEESLAFKLQPVVIEEEEVVEEEPDDRRRDLDGRVLQAAPDETECTCCSRPIFARAAKTIDDQPYCPECFYKKKDQEKNEQINSTATGCSTCGTELKKELLADIEGFSICKPCLASGPDLALDIAKKRRQKTLEQMRDKLSD